VKAELAAAAAQLAEQDLLAALQVADVEAVRDALYRLALVAPKRTWFYLRVINDILEQQPPDLTPAG
jgi:hypothetical protein